jgi:hypothetical protein
MNNDKRQKCVRCKMNLTLDNFKKKRDDTYQKTCGECLVKRREWDKKNRGSSTKKLTIEECQEFASGKGGKCLSTEYKNNRTKMLWCCEKGHEWSAIFNSIKRGTWCLKCSGSEKLTIKECQEFASGKGGKCLSTEYKNTRTKMLWSCEEGHEWSARFDHIKKGHWCPKCSGNEKLTIKECQEFAENKGGECLSTEYKNSMTKMLWCCEEGHEWSARFHAIKNGSWCPSCSKGRSEELARSIFEEIMGLKFPSTRPDFLKYKSGLNLELDGYNSALKLAFEYQGRQHYEYIPSLFHKKGYHVFEEQQHRDQWKYKECQKNGVTLILIPYHFTFNNKEEMKLYIYDQLLTTEYIIEIETK